MKTRGSLRLAYKIIVFANKHQKIINVGGIVYFFFLDCAIYLMRHSFTNIQATVVTLFAVLLSFELLLMLILLPYFWEREGNKGFRLYRSYTISIEQENGGKEK